MSRYKSTLDTSTDSFSSNRSQMLALIDQLREIENRACNKSDQRRERFAERGQLTPRERLAHLLDPGMPFVNLYNLASYLVDDKNPVTSIPGANMITGIGYVSGVRSLVFVDDSGISAGAATAKSVEKGLGCLKIALKQKLPFIHLVESAGANLMEYTVEMWAHGGGMFHGLAKLSAAGIPTITVLHGPSTAGGAYQPGLSDYVIGVKKNGMAALAGAALVRAATGEVASDDELGGVQMHATTTGLVEFLANNDADGIDIAREVLGNLGWNENENSPALNTFDDPIYSPDEIAGLVGADTKQAYDARELIARIVDGSGFTDFKPEYGISTVCCQASIHGQRCGIIGNNGPIDPQGATKAAQFMQLCDASNLPLVFLHNTTGYIVGTQSEQAGMIKHGSKMIQAVSNVRVPKIAFYVGASFGAGNYGMCGFAYEPDFLFSWPNAKTGVMGGEQAALTMSMVMQNAAKRRGQELDGDTLNAQSAKIQTHFDQQSHAFYTSGHLLDHGIIDPRDTRNVAGYCLSICQDAKTKVLSPNAFGVARM